MAIVSAGGLELSAWVRRETRVRKLVNAGSAFIVSRSSWMDTGFCFDPRIVVCSIVVTDGGNTAGSLDPPAWLMVSASTAQLSAIA